jgi:YegS/Rv2252/BmrU family lipid kinase
MIKAFVIVNPVSGQVLTGLERDRLGQLLTEAGVAPTLHLTQGPGDATRAAREASAAGFDQVVVAAGDGTVHEVAAGMVGSETPLGIVPLGTGNVLARELGLPLRTDAAVRVLAEGHTRRIDVGRSGDNRFLIMAGFGADAEMVRRVNARLKHVIGQGAFYLAAAGRLLIERPRRMVVTVDDQVREGEYWLVALANGAQYAPHLSFSPDAVIDDGVLDVALVRGGRLDLANTLRRALAGARPSEKNVEVLRGQNVHIQCERPTHHHLDGDVIGAVTEVHFELQPQALSVIVPGR